MVLTILVANFRVSFVIIILPELLYSNNITLAEFDLIANSVTFFSVNSYSLPLSAYNIFIGLNLVSSAIKALPLLLLGIISNNEFTASLGVPIISYDNFFAFFSAITFTCAIP